MTTPYCVKCDLVLQQVTEEKYLAVINTIYRCPGCKWEVGIVTPISPVSTKVVTEK
jgi:phage FluMu protein Com